MLLPVSTRAIKMTRLQHFYASTRRMHIDAFLNRFSCESQEFEVGDGMITLLRQMQYDGYI